MKLPKFKLDTRLGRSVAQPPAPSNAKRQSGNIGRIGEFVKHHDRTLTIIGAAIVFATFVAKDEIRDNIKERIGALQFAEMKNNLKLSAMFVGNAISNQERAISNDQSTRVIKENSDIKFPISVNIRDPFGSYHLYNALQFDQEEFDSINETANLLDHKKFNDGGSYSSMKSTFDTVKEVVDNLDKSDNSILANEPDFDQKSYLKELDFGLLQELDLELMMAKENDKISSDIATYESHLQHNYVFWDRIISVLFVFGWFLSLVGKLWKHDESDNAAV